MVGLGISETSKVALVGNHWTCFGRMLKHFLWEMVCVCVEKIQSGNPWNLGLVLVGTSY